MPNNNPANIDTIKKATKGLSFAQVTSITNRTRQIKMDSMAIDIYAGFNCDYITP
ncbi:hypothetical protein [Mucilaginibacter sp.]